MNEVTGKPIDRVDGRLKVTGAIKYAAEYHLPGLIYGVVVPSTIAKGAITASTSIRSLPSTRLIH